MMSCAEIRKVLSAYLDGELGEPLRGEVDIHLRGCQRCQRHLAQLQRLNAAVAQLRRVEPPPGFVGAVRRRIHGREDERTWVDILFRPVWLKLPLEALGVFALAAGTVFLVQHESDRKQAPVGAVATDAVTVRSGAGAGVAGEAERAMTLQPAEKKLPAAPFGGAEGLAQRALRAEDVAEARSAAAVPQEAVAGARAAKEVAVGERREAERLTVTTGDFALAEKRIREAVEVLGGKILEVEPQDRTLRCLRVRIPASNVERFRSVVGEIAGGGADVLGRKGVVLSSQAAGPVGRRLVGGASKTENGAMTELEVQIVPPAK
ncbi:MAG: anti-sigma factor [Verrucomicrobiae bacterium]|nr:anti-sigma factor [Verrucomicrobiae bacterium]